MKNNIVAICYDFDKTLSPDDMQAQGFIQSLGMTVSDFWKEIDVFANENCMDMNLSYMYIMMQKSKLTKQLTKEELKEYGAKIQLFSGVKDWFDRINKFALENNIVIEHYIISSGLKEMIEGTNIAEEFKKIYASSFIYNDKNEAIWPARVVNYTNKTQYLFRISKGILDEMDDGVNDLVPKGTYRIPFTNIIYIGDSDTDVPCMKLVTQYGGHAVGVYNPQTKNAAKVEKMLKDGRICEYVPADYNIDSELDLAIKNILITLPKA